MDTGSEKDADKFDQKWGILMKESQDGSKRSYKKLLEELRRASFSYLGSRIKNKGAIDDVAQEILMAVHQARHTYNPEKPFAPWFYAIARYKLIDYLRANGRLTDREVYSEEAIENTFSAAKVDGFIERDLIHSAVAKLPVKQQKAIQLLKLDGYSVKEVASLTGMSESAVKVTAHRAYKALKKFLGGEV